MIPKILHLYWGKNQPLSYLRSLTVTSFRKLNPDWEIKIWVPKKTSHSEPWETGEQPNFYKGKDYLSTLEGIKVFDFKSIGISDDLPEVHKSDILRWCLLATQQGIWSDFDILYVQPITKKMRATWLGAGLCCYEVPPIVKKQFQAIGFLTSEGYIGKQFFFQLFKYAIDKQGETDYQSYGTKLLDDFLKNQWHYKATPFYHNYEIVYPYPHEHNFLKYFQEQRLMEYDEQKTIGLHWYAGNPLCAEKESQINDINIKDSNWYICQEALQVLGQIPIKKKKIKYSFIIPYYRRIVQLKCTLNSFVDYYQDRDDFEVIIANDIKSSQTLGEDEYLLETLQLFQLKFSIRVITTGNPESWNPVMAYQAAVKISRGDYLILTSPECVHRVNILSGLDAEFDKGPQNYVICGCLSIASDSLSREQQTPGGYWYQHSKYRNVGCHFCSALHRDVYNLVGGFDEEYSKGIGFDDDDFRNRLEKAQVHFVFRDDLLVVHLNHLHNRPDNFLLLHEINKTYFNRVWGEHSFRAEQRPLKEKSVNLSIYHEPVTIG